MEACDLTEDEKKEIIPQCQELIQQLFTTKHVCDWVMDFVQNHDDKIYFIQVRHKALVYEKKSVQLSKAQFIKQQTLD